MSSEPDSARYYAEMEFQFAKELGNAKFMAEALSLIGSSYKIMGVYDKAIEAYLESIELNKKTGNKYYIIGDFNGLGNVYLSMDDYVSAMKQYQYALEIIEDIGTLVGKGGILNNIGEIYRETGDHQEALIYYTKSYNLHKKLEEHSGMATALLNIGEVHNVEKNYQDAIDYYNRSLVIYKELEDKASVSFTLSCLGDVYNVQGYLKRSDSIASIALQKAQEVRSVIEIRMAADCLYRVYKQQGKSTKALEMHELYTLIKDSMENKESTRKLMQKEYQYQYDQQKTLEEARHSEEIALSEEREKRQRLISIGTGFGLLVLLFFVVLIYKRYKLANYQKHLIQEKNEQITDSIQYAKRIQHASLTSPQYLSTVFDNYFVFYQPKDIVSGDFYWAHNIDEDQVMVAVCDCTGHGVPGAFMSMISNSLLNEVVIDNANYQPEKVLDILSVEVIKTLKQDKDKIEALDGLDMTLLKIDKKNRTVQFAGAGHTLYLLRDGKVYEEKGDPYPIGYFFGRRKPYVTKDLTLNKGDVLYLTSDGYIEQFGPMNKKKFGYQAFKNLLVEAGNEPIENQEDFFKNAINNWKANTTQVDDMLVMGIRL